ncbi:MAG: ammonium transporter, partial [Opitutae bacterium]|nr:ammonium transporter [Opitutae bacterium]
MKIKKTLLALLLSSSAFLLAGTVGAQELPVAEAAEAVADAVSFEDGYAAFMESPGAAFFTISNLWLLISAALVFIMHLGF